MSIFNHKRIDKYLTSIISEVNDINSILRQTDAEILKSPNLIKSLKYSVIIIAEAIGGALQHILAKKHYVAVQGYAEILTKTKAYQILPNELIERLQPFARFRNMLVHQYWRIEDEVFLENLRSGVKDFEEFVRITKQYV